MKDNIVKNVAIQKKSEEQKERIEKMLSYPTPDKKEDVSYRQFVKFEGPCGHTSILIKTKEEQDIIKETFLKILEKRVKDSELIIKENCEKYCELTRIC